jgi:hypothetical protein
MMAMTAEKRLIASHEALKRAKESIERDKEVLDISSANIDNLISDLKAVESRKASLGFLCLCNPMK